MERLKVEKKYISDKIPKACFLKVVEISNDISMSSTDINALAGLNLTTSSNHVVDVKIEKIMIQTKREKIRKNCFTLPTLSIIMKGHAIKHSGFGGLS